MLPAHSMYSIAEVGREDNNYSLFMFAQCRKYMKSNLARKRGLWDNNRSYNTRGGYTCAKKNGSLHSSC
jgi:hypothetical protein